MDSKFFLNAEFPFHFQQYPSSSIPTSVIANWEKSTDQSLQFDSSMSLMAESFIGKLGNFGNSEQISPHFQPNMSPIDQFSELPALNSTVAEFTVDPGFSERAARYSCFGSRSFHGRTCQIGLNQNEESQYNCNKNDEIPVNANKLFRVSSSPSFKEMGSHHQIGDKNSSGSLQDRSELANSNSQEESSVSGQKPVGESGFKASNELNSKKRKTVSKAKSKETQFANTAKGIEVNDNSNSKRSKGDAGNLSNNNEVRAKEEKKGNREEKQNKANTKPPEPPKDYIHVRARRGQATDSHSLAERVRREKISERMKLLQDLVPGCNKVTGKALMLDEIINYVQSLQRQVEFLSMKLASVNTRLDVPKDMFQTAANQMAHPMLPIESSMSMSHQAQQNLPFHGNGAIIHCPVEPSAMSQDLSIRLPPLQGFNHTPPQLSSFYEDELRSNIHMNINQSPCK